MKEDANDASLQKFFVQKDDIVLWVHKKGAVPIMLGQAPPLEPKELSKYASSRGSTGPDLLLADSEWTRRDSNPSHCTRVCTQMQFDTYRTPRTHSCLANVKPACSKISNQKSEFGVGKWSYPRFCFFRHLSRCLRTGDACKSYSCVITATGPAHFCASPPALLPIGHSPSRRRLRRRWWALTPPVRPCPICMGGILFCCSCRQTCPLASRRRFGARSALTCCFVRQSCAVVRRHGESGSSSDDCENRNRQRRNTCLPTPRINEPPGNRTLNLQLKRLLLCQLS